MNDFSLKPKTEYIKKISSVSFNDTVFFLSDDYQQSQKNLLKPNMYLPFRSYSHEQILHKSNHYRSDSADSIDLFKLVVPTINGSSLSSLTCSICSLPMMKPTLLPCQHTFCFKCIENNQHIRPCSLPTHSTNNNNNNQLKIITCQKCFRTHRINSLSDLEENRSMELLINTLLCEICQQLHPSNQLDTCLYCFGVLCPNCYDDHLKTHQNETKFDKNLYRIISADETNNVSLQTSSSDNQIFKPRSFNIEKQLTNETKKLNNENENNENIDPSQINSSKKRSNNIFQKIIHPSRHRQSNSISNKDSITKTPSPISSKQTSSAKVSNRSKQIFDIKFEEISNKESHQSPPPPITPVRRFLNLFDQYTHTNEYIKQCKQRQSELNHSVEKLIEVLTRKTNENITQISYYWSYLKQIIFDQYKINPKHFQLFNYLLKTCCSTFDSRKSIELYFQQNDEINAAIQVLLTTLTIIDNQQTILTINQLFDREEQTITRTLQRQLDTLSSSYTEELSFITERINVYEKRFASWKNSNTTDLDSITYEWTQIIEHDYPSLIEKISNDFITKIPQVEKILVQMLRNMKKRLLNINNSTSSRRTSES